MLLATELPEAPRRAVARLAAGRARLLVVGPGGSGKTEVVDAAVAALGERGVDAARVDGRAPGALADLVARLVSPAPPIPGGPGTPGDDAAQVARALVDGLPAGLRAVVVDDAHLLDAPAAAVLAAVWALAPSRRLAVLVTRRPGARPAALAQLDEAAAPEERLWLGPLDVPAVAERLANATGGTVEGPLAAAVAEYTAGSPRLVDRLVAEGRWAPGQGPPPPLVDEVQGAVAALGPTAARVAHLLAAIDEPAPGGPGEQGGPPPAAAAALRRELLSLLDEGGAVGDALVAAGLARPPAGALVPAVAAALRRATPAGVVAGAVADLLGALGDEASPSLRAELHHLAGHRDAQAGAAFLAAGESLLRARPGEALRWAELAAGADPAPAGAAWLRARALLAAGDVDRALGAAEAARTPVADPVVAALLPRLGRWADSAARYRALGGEAAPFARLAELRAGGLAAAGAGAQPPPAPRGDGGLVAEAVATAADALGRSLAPPPTGPAPDLVRLLGGACDVVERVAPPLPLPDTPHALAATLCTLSGDHATADALLGRALETRAGGAHLEARHRVLRAWSLLQAGRLATVARELDVLATRRLPPVDALALRSVEAGLARRAGSLTHLEAIWRQAGPMLRLHPPEVLDVATVGELVVAAAKLGHHHAVERWSGEVAQLAPAARSPWRAWAAWVAFQAELARGGDARAAAAELAAAGAGMPGALGGLAQAAPTWADAARGVVDGPAVLAAVEALRGAGFPFEARQLASHAALHTAGGDLGRALLEAARRLHALLEWSAPPAAPDEPAPTAEAASAAAPAPAAELGFELTDREEEVARLLLAGHSYKEVAGLLFISTKTVERHVTNTRAKIGAATRAEFFAALRRYFAAP